MQDDDLFVRVQSAGQSQAKLSRLFLEYNLIISFSPGQKTLGSVYRKGRTVTHYTLFLLDLRET